MAGIGFEIRDILREDSYTALLKAYSYAGLISSGPWILSILTIMAIGVLSINLSVPRFEIVQFLVSITYLMSASLMLTGILQLLFTRYVSDRVFEKKERIILPNLIGAMTVTTIVAGIFGVTVLAVLFDTPVFYEVLMLSSFVVLCNLWLVVVFLSGMKAYHTIILIMAMGYGVTGVSAILLSGFGLVGLLSGFLLGHALLVFAFLFIVIRDYPSDELVDYDFTRKKQVFVSLLLAGVFYNAGVWADKIIFWFSPETSFAVIGPLRASVIYDLPIFLAYLSIIPGMAVFLVRMEADFVDHYDRFYTAVREGGSLEDIYYLKGEMVYAARLGMYEIFKVQGITVVILFLLGPIILEMLGISSVLEHLYRIDLVGVSVQVMVMALLNVMYYLDARRMAMWTCLFFFVSNGVLSAITVYLGPAFYGYGFTVTMILTAILGGYLLSEKMNRLEYETFMLRY